MSAPFNFEMISPSRFVWVFLLVGAGTAFILCFFSKEREMLPQTKSVIQTQNNLAMLQNILCSRTYSIEEKSSALFAIFSHHIKPGISNREIFSVIGSSEWLANIEFVDKSFDVSGRDIFPDAEEGHCIIVVKIISSEKHSGYVSFWFSDIIAKNEFLAIFSNSSLKVANLLGFALHIPHPIVEDSIWRTEISTVKGLSVQEHW